MPFIESDPNNDTLMDWGEFTYNDVGLFLNSSQVDIFSIPHTVSATSTAGERLSTGTIVANGRENVTDGILADPDWAGTVLRVLAPGKAADAGTFDPNYLDSHINDTWAAYAGRDLSVVPFGDRPEVRFTGRTSGNTMNFTDSGGARVASFEKPTTADVWGCDGALGAPNDLVVGPIARTLCAALVRGTLGTIDTQPSLDAGAFYQNSTPNLYGRLVHENMVDGKAYAFAFDDVGNFESLVNVGDAASAGITLDPFVGGDGTSSGGSPCTSAPARTPAPTPNTGSTPASAPTPEDVGGASSAACTSLVSQKNGYCIDVPRSNFGDGIKLGIFSCNGSDAQRWTIANGRVQTENGLCMDAAGGSTADGTPIQIATCSDNAAQQFSLTADGDLVNAGSGKCVAIEGFANALDVPLILFGCTGTPNQKWSSGN